MFRIYKEFLHLIMDNPIKRRQTGWRHFRKEDIQIAEYKNVQHVIREVKQWHYHTTTKWLKLKGVIIPNTGDDVEQPESSRIVIQWVKGYNHFGERSVVFKIILFSVLGSNPGPLSGTVVHVCNSRYLGGLREDPKFQASSNNLLRPVLKFTRG